MAADIDIRPTTPAEYRLACDAMRAGLLNGPISDEDWERHGGGWIGQPSITAWDGPRCVGNVGAFLFDTVVPGGARLGTVGVTRIGLLPTHTRRGLLTRMLTKLLRDGRADGRPLASLRASEAVIYGRFGFGVAGEGIGTVVDCRRARPIRNVAHGSVRLLARDEIMDVVPPLYDRVALRVGAISRPDFFWKRYLDPALRGDKGGFVVVHTGVDGIDDGFATYVISWAGERFEEGVGTGEVHDLWGASSDVELALWDYLIGVDLVTSYVAELRPEDDVLQHAVADRRAVSVRRRFDEQWLRLLDVEVALAARTYRPTAPITIAVTDSMFEDNNDTFLIEPGGPSARSVRRLGRGTAADVEVGIDALSAAYLGSRSWSVLAAAGQVVGSAEAVARADDLFAHRPLAFCGSSF